MTRLSVRSLLSVVAPLCGVALFFAPAPEGVAPIVVRTAGLVVFTVGLWATQGLPEHVTGLLFLLLAVLTEVAPASIVFSGFTSGTLWLVLGGLIIAEAVRSTALAERLALGLLGRFLGSYALLVCATVTVASVLCFLMPATLARVLLLIPIVDGLAERVGLKRGQSGHTGLMLAALVSTYQVGTGVLPANAPNLALAGAAESVYGVHLIYGEYLLVQFPVLGVAKMALIIAITCWLFPARIEHAALTRAEPKMSAAQWRLALVVGLALVLWATDFLHGIRPGWIALAAGLATILPGIGVMPVAAFSERINFGPYFYIGSVLGLGAVIAYTGLSSALGSFALPVLGLAPDADFRNFMLLTFASTIAGLATTNPAQPGIMVPLAAEIAQATGWSLNAALMIAAVGFSSNILPYTVPPMVVGMQIARIGFRDAARYTFALAIPNLFLLAPLDFLWWKTIGYFG